MPGLGCTAGAAGLAKIVFGTTARCGRSPSCCAAASAQRRGRAPAECIGSGRAGPAPLPPASDGSRSPAPSEVAAVADAGDLVG